MGIFVSCFLYILFFQFTYIFFARISRFTLNPSNNVKKKRAHLPIIKHYTVLHISYMNNLFLTVYADNRIHQWNFVSQVCQPILFELKFFTVWENVEMRKIILLELFDLNSMFN